ncbi:hypothetical protein FVE85_1167 [Porphyridium purpureum]|uniref:Uncharacterized protein n=1 Tax=Porphyridium purpureum TaxID=35688 RepID=A0A5J4Z278_PORPP|nr:hypothetical protein FVE85_1167 [Porphyridium purpureum]|eukprot:POR6691..scf208_2
MQDKVSSRTPDVASVSANGPRLSLDVVSAPQPELSGSVSTPAPGQSRALQQQCEASPQLRGLRKFSSTEMENFGDSRLTLSLRHAASARDAPPVPLPQEDENGGEVIAAFAGKDASNTPTSSSQHEPADSETFAPDEHDVEAGPFDQQLDVAASHRSIPTRTLSSPAAETVLPGRRQKHKETAHSRSTQAPKPSGGNLFAYLFGGGNHQAGASLSNPFASATDTWTSMTGLPSPPPPVPACAQTSMDMRILKQLRDKFASSVDDDYAKICAAFRVPGYFLTHHVHSPGGSAGSMGITSSSKASKHAQAQAQIQLGRENADAFGAAEPNMNAFSEFATPSSIALKMLKVNGGRIISAGLIPATDDLVLLSESSIEAFSSRDGRKILDVRMLLPPDETHFALAVTGSVLPWRSSTEQLQMRYLRATHGCVDAARMQVVACSEDGLLCMYSLHSGRMGDLLRFSRLAEHRSETIVSVQLVVEHSELVCLSARGAVWVLDAQDLLVRNKAQCLVTREDVPAMIFAEDLGAPSITCAYTIIDSSRASKQAEEGDDASELRGDDASELCGDDASARDEADRKRLTVYLGLSDGSLTRLWPMCSDITAEELDVGVHERSVHETQVLADGRFAVTICSRPFQDVLVVTDCESGVCVSRSRFPFSLSCVRSIADPNHSGGIDAVAAHNVLVGGERGELMLCRLVLAPVRELVHVRVLLNFTDARKLHASYEVVDLLYVYERRLLVSAHADGTVRRWWLCKPDAALFSHVTPFAFTGCEGEALKLAHEVLAQRDGRAWLSQMPNTRVGTHAGVVRLQETLGVLFEGSVGLSDADKDMLIRLLQSAQLDAQNFCSLADSALLQALSDAQKNHFAPQTAARQIRRGHQDRAVRYRDAVFVIEYARLKHTTSVATAFLRLQEYVLKLMEHCLAQHRAPVVTGNERIGRRIDEEEGGDGGSASMKGSDLPASEVEKEPGTARAAYSAASVRDARELVRCELSELDLDR